MVTPSYDLDALIREPGPEVFLEESGWPDEASPAELEEALAYYVTRYEYWLAAFEARLGAPDVTETSDEAPKEELYFEAVRLAAWKQGDGFLVLAVGQHDRETPLFVSFGRR